MPDTDVFQRVATVHRERFAKLENTRFNRKKKLMRRQAYFKDTGIMEMWDDVKHIKIPNPIPEMLEGLTITIGDLSVPTAIENLEQAGLVVYNKNDTYVEWSIDDHSDNEDVTDTKHVVYRDAGLSKGNNMALPGNHPEAKKNFVDSFIKWLAKYITPQMLIDMDIDIETPSVVKRSRKILQLTET